MLKNEEKNEAASFSALAARLEQERDDILEQWRVAAAASGGEEIVVTLSRKEFDDNIPNFLAHFCASLRGETAKPTAPARQHGAHRWQQGLSFGEVIHEWSLLHRVLMRQIATLWDSIGIAPESMPRIYELLSEDVQQAVETSLIEYNSRVRAQADAVVRDLESALDQRKATGDARGRGLHDASHDLRGSLQVIQTSCYVLRGLALEGKTQEIVERLAHASDSLNILFNDLLDLARLEAGREERHLSEFDVAGLFNQLITSMQSSAEAKGLALTRHEGESLVVHSDEAKLRRIAQNLILNALNHTVEGSVDVGWYVDSDTSWCFYVSDTGPGMTITDENPLAANLEQAGQGHAETQPTSGQTAHKTSESSDDSQGQVQGEGIGLAIVYQLCELLDAVIEVDSKTGYGTKLGVQLPLTYYDPLRCGPGQAE